MGSFSRYAPKYSVNASPATKPANFVPSPPVNDPPSSKRLTHVSKHSPLRYGYQASPDTTPHSSGSPPVSVTPEPVGEVTDSTRVMLSVASSSNAYEAPAASSTAFATVTPSAPAGTVTASPLPQLSASPAASRPMTAPASVIICGGASAAVNASVTVSPVVSAVEPSSTAVPLTNAFQRGAPGSLLSLARTSPAGEVIEEMVRLPLSWS